MTESKFQEKKKNINLPKGLKQHNSDEMLCWVHLKSRPFRLPHTFTSFDSFGTGVVCMRKKYIHYKYVPISTEGQKNENLTEIYCMQFYGFKLHLAAAVRLLDSTEIFL